jgi:hypothetical protein
VINSNQTQQNLSGFTAIEELQELEIISLENDELGGSDYYRESVEDQHTSGTDFYEMETYSGDIQGEKREGGAVVPILPWKGIHKKSLSSVNTSE